jgi:AcrR family transcriptional regulator
MSLTSHTNPSRLQIIDTAERLFAEQGINPIGLADISAAANIDQDQLAAIFPTKNAVIEAALDDRHEKWMTRLAASVDAFTYPVDRVLSIFSFLEAWFAEESFHHCAFVTSYGELGPATGWVSDMIRRHKTAFDTFVRGLAVRADLPATITASIVLLAEGAQAAAATTQSPAPARDARTSAALLIAVYQSAPADPDLV